MNIDNQVMFEDNKKIYLKNIRKTALKVCLVLFLMNILAIIASSISQLLVYIISYVYKDLAGTNIITPQMLNYITSYLPCIISEIILIPIGFVLLRKEIDMSWFKIFSKTEIKDSNIDDTRKFGVLAVFSVFGITFIVTQILSVVLTGLDKIGYTLILPDLDFSGDIIANVLAMLYTCIMAPILEEIILRGFVLNSFKKYGNMTAVIVSAIAFAMIHMNPVQIPVGFLTGLLLGYVTIKTGNIRLSIIIHIANNTLNSLPAEVLGQQNVLALGFSLILMITGAIVLARFLYLYGRDFTNLSRNESKIYAGIGTKLVHTMLTVTSILFIIEWLFNNIVFLMHSIVQK